MTKAQLIAMLEPVPSDTPVMVALDDEFGTTAGAIAAMVRLGDPKNPKVVILLHSPARVIDTHSN